MKVLAIDLGTSLAKLGFFDGGSLLRKEKGIPLEGMHALSEEFNPRRIIVSSVTLGEHEIVPLLPEEAHLTVLSHRTPIPVKLAYRTPETLGTDRIAAVVGAWKLFPGRSVLVIDTGAGPRKRDQKRVRAPAVQDRAGLGQDRANRLFVIDDEAEMSPVVRRLRSACLKGQELIAEIDEGHGVALAAQFEVEQATVEGERLVDVADFEGDMV